MELIKKISPKTVVGGKSAILALVKKGNGKTDLFHCIGIAVSTKSGESNYGEWTALRGTFEAMNCETGEITKSPTCFLPDVALDLVLGALTGNQSVQFALLIGAREPEGDENTAYVYTCKPLQEIGGKDALVDMRKLLPSPDKK